MATEKRLIPYSDAVRFLRDSKVPETGAFSKGINKGLNIALSALGNEEIFPHVDAVEVVHGEWSTIEDDYCGLTALQCSECNQEYWFEDEPPIKIYNYCPNCGAKMDGDGNG